jgi:hypothetical protein
VGDEREGKGRITRRQNGGERRWTRRFNHVASYNVPRTVCEYRALQCTDDDSTEHGCTTHSY